jgi:hypothetical protein
LLYLDYRGCTPEIEFEKIKEKEPSELPAFHFGPKPVSIQRISIVLCCIPPLRPRSVAAIVTTSHEGCRPTQTFRETS